MINGLETNMHIHMFRYLYTITNIYLNAEYKLVFYSDFNLHHLVTNKVDHCLNFKLQVAVRVCAHCYMHASSSFVSIAMGVLIKRFCILN